MGSLHEDRPGHPDAERVAAYVERCLTAGERAELESHLAECAECRREVAEVTLFLRRERSRRKSWLVPSAVAAAAAALLLVALWPSDVGDGDGARFREAGSAEGGALPAIEAVSPAPDGALPADSGVFTWRGLGTDAFYRLTVATEEGEVVWREETEDTTVSLPPDVGLAPEGTYFWFVDALFPDGREATTGVRRFRATP